MWLSEIDSQTEYILQFCQNGEGRRYCVFRKSNEAQSEFCVSESRPVPLEIMKSKSGNELSDFCNIVFGGHGEWYTEAESESMHNYDLGKTGVIQWSTEQAPCFAPK